MKHSILFTFLFSGSVLANQANIDAIEQAARSLNHNELAQLVNQTSGYDKALANYRLSIAHSLNANTDAAHNALDMAIEQLVKLTVLEAENAENWSLLAQAYGYKISLAPMKGPIMDQNQQAPYPKLTSLLQTTQEFTLLRQLVNTTNQRCLAVVNKQLRNRSTKRFPISTRQCNRY